MSQNGDSYQIADVRESDSMVVGQFGSSPHFAHAVALGLVLVVALSVTRAAGVLLMQRWWGAAGFEPSWRGAAFLLGLIVVVSVGIVGGGLFGLAGATWESLGWRRRRWGWEIGRGLLAALVIGLIALVFAVVGARLLGLKSPAPTAGAPTVSGLGVLLSVAFGFLVASWSEENLFRGYLQPLLVSRWGLGPGILVQAALFSLAHVGYAQAWPFFVLLFATGIVLGWLRGRDGSLVAAFVAHGLVG